LNIWKKRNSKWKDSFFLLPLPTVSRRNITGCDKNTVVCMPFSTRMSFVQLSLKKWLQNWKCVVFKNSTAACFISESFYYFFILLLFTVSSVRGYINRTMKSYRTFWFNLDNAGINAEYKHNLLKQSLDRFIVIKTRNQLIHIIIFL